MTFCECARICSTVAARWEKKNRLGVVFFFFRACSRPAAASHRRAWARRHWRVSLGPMPFTWASIALACAATPTVTGESARVRARMLLLLLLFVMRKADFLWWCLSARRANTRASQGTPRNAIRRKKDRERRERERNIRKKTQKTNIEFFQFQSCGNERTYPVVDSLLWCFVLIVLIVLISWLFFDCFCFRSVC